MGTAARDAARLATWAGAAATAAAPDGHNRVPGIGSVQWIRQVHGAAVVIVGPEVPVSDPGDPARGVGPAGVPPRPVFAGTGDALVSAAPATGLVVLTADCASVALASPEGVFAAVHAGWRGLLGGVIDEAVAALRTFGATDVVAALGPCIHAECYEFGERDLDLVAAELGPGVRGLTTEGRPALDMPAAVSSGLRAAGVTEVPGVDRCTACAAGYFSHRRRADVGRQALLVWSDGPPSDAAP